jgi:hypothetical protein
VGINIDALISEFNATDALLSHWEAVPLPEILLSRWDGRVILILIPTIFLENGADFRLPLSPLLDLA